MNDFIRALTYQYPRQIPVKVSLLPATWARYGAELQVLCLRHPALFQGMDASEGVKYYTPPSYHQGTFTDAWGCVWRNIREGYESIVTGHPLPNREDVWSLAPPKEDIGLPHGFFFLRLMDLRGFEELMIDFAEEPPELQRLIDVVRDYDVAQMEKLVSIEKGEIVYVGDDNGIQNALPISPDSWRKYIKPAYRAIYDAAHRAGKYVYMHTDGCIWPVMPDMQEAGADVINPQIRANGLENLVRVCKGRIPIELDLDRQLFPFATPKELTEHIEECTRALYLPQGGLMLVAECAADVPLENIEAICCALERMREFQG